MEHAQAKSRRAASSRCSDYARHAHYASDAASDTGNHTSNTGNHTRHTIGDTASVTNHSAEWFADANASDYRAANNSAHCDNANSDDTDGHRSRNRARANA